MFLQLYNQLSKIKLIYILLQKKKIKLKKFCITFYLKMFSGHQCCHNYFTFVTSQTKFKHHVINTSSILHLFDIIYGLLLIFSSFYIHKFIILIMYDCKKVYRKLKYNFTEVFLKVVFH